MNGATDDSKRKIDGEFGPGTIDSEDEIENYSGSGSESEEELLMKRKAGAPGDFFQDFTFVESVRDYQRDSWNDVLKYIKVPKERALLSRIERIRKEELKKERAAKGLDDSAEGLELKQENSSDDEFLPDPEKKDTLKVRELDIMRKEKQKNRPEKDTRTKEQIAQDEINAQFFEDAPPVETEVTFLEMNLSRVLLKAIDSLGYDNPTAIQAATIPVALQGRDICGCAATGTGKTAAFMLPILERLIFKPPEDAVTRVLILLPTRELGVQVFQVAKDLSKYTSIDIALSVGGLDQRTQVAVLSKMPDIVIATPGRLLDHLKNTPNFGIEGVEILVLDEADRLLDEHFEEQMKDVINQCAGNRQTMLFSATMTDKVQRLALVSLRNPVKVFVNSNTTVARNLRQEFIRLRPNQEDTRDAVLAYLVTRTFNRHCMVFVPRKYLCHHFVIMLRFLGVEAGELHSDLKQAERLISLQKFKEGEHGVLIATDVAARGLDIKGVKTVINYMLPRTYSSYVHRVGRTARAGHGGRSISIASDREYTMLREIKKSSKSPLFERIIDKDTLTLYQEKLNKVKPLMARVRKEEAEEKQLKAMEQAVSKMQQKLNNPDKENGEMTEKMWRKEEFKDPKFRKQMRTQGKLLKQNKTKKVKKKQMKPTTVEDKRIMHEMKFEVQRAKKNKKQQRIRSANPDNPTDMPAKRPTHATAKQKAQPGKNKRKRSSFDSELTKTDRKSVKKFRYGASYAEKKEEFEKKYPGKKFKPIRK